MRMALDTHYNGDIHDRLLVRMGSNLWYWEVSQVGNMQPGQEPICLSMFFALLHTLKECLVWPRQSFSCPAAHYASAAICQLWGEPGQPAFHTAPGHSQRPQLARARQRPIPRLMSSAVDWHEVVAHISQQTYIQMVSGWVLEEIIDMRKPSQWDGSKRNRWSLNEMSLTHGNL